MFPLKNLARNELKAMGTREISSAIVNDFAG